MGFLAILAILAIKWQLWRKNLQISFGCEVSVLNPIISSSPDTKEGIYGGGSQVPMLDPITVISAMAAVVKSVGFVVTGRYGTRYFDREISDSRS